MHRLTRKVGRHEHACPAMVGSGPVHLARLGFAPRSAWTKRRTLAYPAVKPWSSTRSCQMAMALRPRRSASTISSRYGSHALALGARPGRGIGAESGGHFRPGGRFWSVRAGGHLAGNSRFCRTRVGGHHRRGNCRFCPRFARAAAATYWDSRGFQIAADGFRANARRLLDARESPAETAQCEDLVPCGVAQDVAHSRGASPARRARQRLDRCQLIAGFEVSMNCRFLGVHRGH
jgi:hypothetical protein